MYYLIYVINVINVRHGNMVLLIFQQEQYEVVEMEKLYILCNLPSLILLFSEGTLDIGKRDILFLIDGSDSTGTSGIAHIRDFILSIVQQLNVHPDQVRVGVVQYADGVKSEFSLNSHNNKQAVLSAIKRLRLMGGRTPNLANAIDFVIKTELKPSAGVRLAEASQHLVVLTGERSPQDVTNYGTLLRDSRVKCIGVGAGGTNTRQLTQIATTPDDVLQVPIIAGLPAIRERFITRLSGSFPDFPGVPDFSEPSKFYPY